MLLTVGFCIFLVVTYNNQQSATCQPIDGEDSGGGTIIKGFINNQRQKRSALSLGWLALKTLLKGTRLIASKLASEGVTYRVYQRPGDFQTALKTFRSLVDPQKIRKIQSSGQSGWIGNVGDRQLVLKRKGWEGYPELELTKASERGYADKIVFKKTGK